MRVESPQQKYLNEVFGLMDPELEEIRETLAAHNVESIAVSGAEARLLQFLVRLGGARKIVEIGTLFGYSTLAMAKALPDDGVVWALEKSADNFAIASKHFAKFPAGQKVRLQNGAALDLLPGLEKEGPFDLVFIDADKGGYVNYLDWAEKNVRRGGLIVGDNTFLFGGVWGESRNPNMGEKHAAIMREFNARLADISRFNSVLIPTVEGLTVAQKL